MQADDSGLHFLYADADRIQWKFFWILRWIFTKRT